MDNREYKQYIKIIELSRDLNISINDLLFNYFAQFLDVQDLKQIYTDLVSLKNNKD